MLAHLTRKRLLRGNARSGQLEYEATGLRWSGANACGDEFQAPVCIVIDVGRKFMILPGGLLYLTGGEEWDTFTPIRLVQLARWVGNGYGFKLLYFDEVDDAISEEAARA